LGEREGRIYSSLVAKRNYYLSHGIGRSGEIEDIQPKAIGSSLLYKLTSLLTLNMIQSVSFTDAVHKSFNKNEEPFKCLLLPTATGLTIALTLLTLKQKKPKASLVIWSRIDQKSCLKAILTAGLIPCICELSKNGDQLETDLQKIEDVIKEKRY